MAGPILCPSRLRLTQKSFAAGRTLSCGVRGPASSPGVLSGVDSALGPHLRRGVVTGPPCWVVSLPLRKGFARDQEPIRRYPKSGAEAWGRLGAVEKAEIRGQPSLHRWRSVARWPPELWFSQRSQGWCQANRWPESQQHGPASCRRDSTWPGHPTCAGRPEEPAGLGSATRRPRRRHPCWWGPAVRERRENPRSNSMAAHANRR